MCVDLYKSGAKGLIECASECGARRVCVVAGIVEYTCVVPGFSQYVSDVTRNKLLDFGLLCGQVLLCSCFATLIG